MEKSEVSQHEMISVAAEPTEQQSVHLDQTSKQPLRRDKAGLPLVPQPTSHKDDPLVSAMLALSVHLEMTLRLTTTELVANPQTPRDFTDQLACNVGPYGSRCCQPCLRTDVEDISFDCRGSIIW